MGLQGWGAWVVADRNSGDKNTTRRGDGDGVGGGGGGGGGGGDIAGQRWWLW
jgi:hypothetical protein